MNKIISLFAVFCIAIALLGCGGGGGGGSPVAPVITDDLTLGTDYPDIKANYTSLQTAMENNSLPANTRTDNFTAHISDSFKDLSGAGSKQELYDMTKSRFERYNIISYQFRPIGHTGNSTTATVSTYMYIKVAKIETPNQVYLETSMTKDVTWVKNSTTNKWEVTKGIPYKSSEVDF